jgi:hypothetical protein
MTFGPLAVALVVLALSGVGCPKPQPAPVTPADADAAAYVTPIRVPSAVTCQAAVRAAKTACPSVDEDALQDICGREDVSYAGRLSAARDCDDVRNADTGASSSGSAHGPVRGR